MKRILLAFIVAASATPAFAARHQAAQATWTFADGVTKPFVDSWQQPAPQQHVWRHREARKRTIARRTRKPAPAPVHIPSPAATIAAAAGDAYRVVRAKMLGALLGVSTGWEDGVSTSKPAIVTSTPRRLVGEIEVQGQRFRFGSGGYGLSVPYGDYRITHDVGSWGARHGALAIGNDARMYDPRLQRYREGMELHADPNGRLMTEGCVAIEQFERFKRLVLSMMAAGAAFLHIDPNGARVSSSPEPVIRVAGAEQIVSEHHARRHVAARHRVHYASR